MPSKLQDPKYQGYFKDLEKKGEKFYDFLTKEGKSTGKTHEIVLTDGPNKFNRYTAVFAGGEQPDEPVHDDPYRYRKSAKEKEADKAAGVADARGYKPGEAEYDAEVGKTFGVTRGVSYKPKQGGPKGTPGQQPEDEPEDDGGVDTENEEDDDQDSGDDGEGGESGDDSGDPDEQAYRDAAESDPGGDPTRDIDEGRNDDLDNNSDDADDEKPKKGGDGEGEDEGEGEGKGKGKPGGGKGKRDTTTVDSVGKRLHTPIGKGSHFKHQSEVQSDYSQRRRDEWRRNGRYKYAPSQGFGSHLGGEFAEIGAPIPDKDFWSKYARRFIQTALNKSKTKFRDSWSSPDTRRVNAHAEISKLSGRPVLFVNHKERNHKPNQYAVFAFIDVSGSLFNEDMLTRFKSILMGVQQRKDADLYIFTFDVGVTNPKPITDPSKIKLVKGGGGTAFWHSFDSVLMSMDTLNLPKKFDACLVFTDGEFPAPPSSTLNRVKSKGGLTNVCFLLTSPKSLQSIPMGCWRAPIEVDGVGDMTRVEK